MAVKYDGIRSSYATVQCFFEVCDLKYKLTGCVKCAHTTIMLLSKRMGSDAQAQILHRRQFAGSGQLVSLRVWHKTKYCKQLWVDSKKNGIAARHAASFLHARSERRHFCLRIQICNVLCGSMAPQVDQKDANSHVT